MALLKILAIGNQEIEAGKTHLLKDVIRDMRRGRSKAENSRDQVHSTKSSTTADVNRR